MLTKHKTNRGFSIIELLVALIIIGVLTTIAITNVANRAEEARVRHAQETLENLSAAQERAAIDTGWFYRMHVLNDVNGGNGQVPNTPTDTSDFVDGILDEPSQTLIGNPERIFIDNVDGTLLTNVDAAFQMTRIAQAESRFNTNFRWRGAYINYPITEPETGQFPEDPWGNPYLMFTQEGFMLEPAGIMVTGNTQQTYGGIFNVLQNASFTPSRFDRMTIISLGPNGVVGDGSSGAEIGSGDDLRRQF